MEAVLAGIFVILFIFAFYGGMFLFLIKGSQKQGKELEKEICMVEEDSLQLRGSPQMKHFLGSFSIKSATELRQMDSAELLHLLKNAAEALSIIEARLGLISGGYDKMSEYRSWIEKDLIGRKKSKELRLKERFEVQADKAQKEISDDFLFTDSVLHIIPEKYRLSDILYKMAEYLEDGEKDSWEGIVATFKTDAFQSQALAHYEDFGNKLERIASNTDKIAKNTAITAFFSGVTAAGTTRIAMKM
ncbi:MAG: hypothetical protein FWB80_09355 [Defluviitaleaceae bacterium]|nr:hypothetical protein [Defluviitaleaceae bacterium]